MDKLHAMATFVRIVESGSLTGAADVQNTSLPTVVRTLASLESFLDVRLLTRTTRKITLTAEGQLYLERCRRILTDIEDTELALTSQQTEPRGKLNITAPVMFGKMHVLPKISDFLKLYNEVSIELLLLDRNINLVEEGIDVAVRIGHLEDSSMIAIPVGEIRQVLCASPDLLKITTIPQQPSDLINQKAVRVTPLSPKPSWNFYEVKNNKTSKDRIGKADTRHNAKRKRITIPISEVLSCNQVDATIDACASGIGFGMFLSYQVMPLVKQNKLRILLSEYEAEPIPVNIVYSHAKLMSTRVRVLVDYLSQTLREEIK